MQTYIVTTLIGVFSVDENNKVILFNPFPKNPEKIAERLKLSELEIIDEEKQLMHELWKKSKQFIFPFRKAGAKHVEPNSKAEQFVKENLRKLAIEKNFVKDQVEFNQLLTRVNSELTKIKISKSISRDNLVVHVNGAMEELDKSVNIFMERLREWYGLHFPEMNRIISSHEKFAKLIEKFGSRENIEDEELNLIKEKSMGTKLSQDDIKIIQVFSKHILELYKLRDDLSKYLEKLLKEVAPNLTELAGPSIAAKLIAKSGGLEKLAKAPSSLIQLIGAEKALFRYLHGRGKSPKYGILFNHPLIQNSPGEHKGKVARTLAAKLSIAVKMDYYSKEYRGDKLKQELQERVKEILSSK